MKFCTKSVLFLKKRVVFAYKKLNPSPLTYSMQQILTAYIRSYYNHAKLKYTCEKFRVVQPAQRTGNTVCVQPVLLVISWPYSSIAEIIHNWQL